MRVLYVYGDDDFGATTFEDEMGVKKAFEIIDENQVLSIEEKGFTVELRTFEDVDPNFVSFVKSRVMDYDKSKHVNFYVEGEENGN